MDDALKGLEAIIHRKHMVLTVCNPSQLRTDRHTNTYRDVSAMDVGDSGKSLLYCMGLGYLCQNPEESGAFTRLRASSLTALSSDRLARDPLQQADGGSSTGFV